MGIKEKLIGKLLVFKVIKNWDDYFLDLFGMKKNRPVIYNLRNDLKYITRGGSTDRNVLNEIWVYKDYSPKGFEINKKDIVIDIGAHIGVFSVYAGEKCSEGKLFSFEPLEENFKLLKKNISINNLKHINPINKACSNKSGKRDLFLTEKNNFGETSFFGKDRKEKVIVDTIKFSEFLKKSNLSKIDLIKMDCEGGEYDILFDLSKKDLEKIKKIVMEVHNINKNKNVWHLASFLIKNGFKIKIKGNPNNQTLMLYCKKGNKI